MYTPVYMCMSKIRSCFGLWGVQHQNHYEVGCLGFLGWFFRFIFYTFRGVCVCTSATGGQNRGSDPLEQALESRVTWVLGSELLSS